MIKRGLRRKHGLFAEVFALASAEFQPHVLPGIFGIRTVADPAFRGNEEKISFRNIEGLTLQGVESPSAEHKVQDVMGLGQGTDESLVGMTAFKPQNDGQNAEVQFLGKKFEIHGVFQKIIAVFHVFYYSAFAQKSKYLTEKIFSAS